MVVQERFALSPDKRADWEANDFRSAAEQAHSRLGCGPRKPRFSLGFTPTFRLHPSRGVSGELRVFSGTPTLGEPRASSFLSLGP